MAGIIIKSQKGEDLPPVVSSVVVESRYRGTGSQGRPEPKRSPFPASCECLLGSPAHGTAGRWMSFPSFRPFLLLSLPFSGSLPLEDRAGARAGRHGGVFPRGSRQASPSVEAAISSAVRRVPSLERAARGTVNSHHGRAADGKPAEGERRRRSGSGRSHPEAAGEVVDELLRRPAAAGAASESPPQRLLPERRRIDGEAQPPRVRFDDREVRILVEPVESELQPNRSERESFSETASSGWISSSAPSATRRSGIRCRRLEVA